MWIFIGLVVSFGLGFGIGKQYAVNKAAQRPSFILYSDVECMNEVVLKDTPDGYAVMNRFVPSGDEGTCGQIQALWKWYLRPIRCLWFLGRMMEFTSCVKQMIPMVLEHVQEEDS